MIFTALSIINYKNYPAMWDGYIAAELIIEATVAILLIFL